MAVLLQWSLEDDFQPSTADANIVGATVTNNLLTTLTRGPVSGYANDISSAGPASGATDVATAISTGSYFYVSMTPTTGKTFSLTDMTFNMARGGGATPRGYSVRSSVDDFATALSQGDIATQRPTFTPITVDLSGASFQAVTGTITFNFYIYGPSTTTVMDWDALTINGSIGDTGTVNQEGFRWRADDGSQTTATWLAAQDTSIIRPKQTNTRIRILLDSTLDRGATGYQLEFREVGSDTWEVLE